MLGHYGWIMALQDIDHSEADRHGGRIYLRASDLRPGYTPKQGDEVTFFLYADENGLGAEDCFATHDPHPPQPPTPSRRQGYSRPKTSWGTRVQQTVTKKCMNAEAKEFVPTVLVPIGTGGENTVSMNPGAKEFVPAPPGLGPSLNIVPTPSSCKDSQHTYCAIFNADDYSTDAESDDDLVAPGLSSDDEEWAAETQNRGEEWAAVSLRCARAVGQVHHEHPWHVRNAAAKAKFTRLPPGLAPPPGLCLA